MPGPVYPYRDRSFDRFAALRGARAPEEVMPAVYAEIYRLSPPKVMGSERALVDLLRQPNKEL